ncbi:putative oxidoreductase [Paenibacillus endophyticus]|uniref:Putative oxidoreductase n=1 Tax=Paenibacillus endophyticus TaxID=1294268 RepID=A0A7W5C727_9BACL|nr:aldo/keto reductase [Paenibacillus endophyticus]MBB3151324.1 putative oxidoreductase [Paenibacillus endophyticus]
MKLMPLERRGISDSRLALGCMGLGGSWDLADPITTDHVRQAEAAVDAALSIGITMYDHADIYTRGKAESIFGQVLKQQPKLREQIVIQSKVGIQLSDGVLPGRFNFSKEHILPSVDGILERLGTEYLDVLLLHRPDPLMEPDEIAEAFTKLKLAGKVRNFGVSNMSPGQIRFLQRALPDPIVVNQLELSLLRHDWVDQGIHVNQKAGLKDNFSEGLMEFMQMEDIQIQAWGPLAQGRFSGRVSENASEAEVQTAAMVKQIADENGTTPESIVLAWLMKHPARIQPVIGTINPQRINACKDAVQQAEIMTREQWYSLLVSARGVNMP